MPDYEVTDQNGKRYLVTAKSADEAHTVITNMVNNATLPLPVPGQPPQNINRPTQRFGFTSADTINPLPAIAAFGDQMFGNIPIAGPHLQQWRDQANANIYGGTPEQARADINDTVSQNPIPAIAGEATGKTLPYAIAGMYAPTAAALGLEGSLASRLGMTAATQYAINVGDRMAHGQTIDPSKGQPAFDTAWGAAIDTAASLPFALVGGRGRYAAQDGRQEAVQFLQRQGVPLTGGQVRNNPRLMYAESELGGGAAQNFSDRQLQAYTRAALRTAGVNADRATREVMDNAFINIGNRFDRLANMTNIRGDQQLQNELLQSAVGYQELKGHANPLLERLVSDVGNIINTNGGSIPGRSYQALRSEISRAMSNSSDPELIGALRDFQDALNDGVARSMNGQTLNAWQTIRRQYANLMTITDALAKPGADAKLGQITPTMLDTAARGAVSKRQYVRGQGDLNDLAAAGVIAMPKMPNSGTASRIASRVAAMSSPTAGVGAYFMGNQDLSHAAIAAGIPAVASVLPAIAGRAMLSAPGRALIANGTNVPAVVARGLVPGISAPLLGR